MFDKVAYDTLNARQKENFNFQKVAGRLADYGFNCIRLNDDWHGADFLAVHVDGARLLRVQLKGRFGLNAKYQGKGLHIAFPFEDVAFVYPHDEILQTVLDRGALAETRSWGEEGHYTWPHLPKWARDILAPYQV